VAQATALLDSAPWVQATPCAAARRFRDAAHNPRARQTEPAVEDDLEQAIRLTRRALQVEGTETYGQAQMPVLLHLLE
jgi:hypothetical protein